MVTCPYCGNENADGALSCAICGSELQTQPTTPVKHRGGSRSAVKTVVLVIVALCVLAGATFGAISLFSPSSRVTRAVNKTCRAAVVTAKEQEDLKYFANTIEKITRTKRVSVFLERKSGDELFNLQLDYSQPGKAANADFSYQIGGENGEVLFALKNKVLQVQVPDISAEVYGISLKKAGNSTLVKFAQNVLDVDTSPLLSKDPDSTLNSYVTGIRETMKKLMDIAEVKAMTKQGDLSVYRVSWSAKDMAKLISGKNRFSISERFLSILDKIDGGCTCYINRQGYLSKIEAVVGADLYVVSFSDGKNPWEEVTVSSSMQGAVLLRGGVVSDNSGFRAFLGPDQGEAKLDLTYSTHNGAFSLKVGKVALNGFLHSTKSATSLQFTDNGGANITVEIGRLTGSPQLLARKYVKIEKMTVGEISALAIKAAANSGKIKNGWNIINGLLQSAATK